MAKYTDHLNCRYQDLLVYLQEYILRGSISASLEDSASYTMGDIRCDTLVFERYSYLGGNRLSLTLTLFGRDGDVHVTAITAGGSQAVFFKINTFGESAFLDKLIAGLDRFTRR